MKFLLPALLMTSTTSTLMPQGGMNKTETNLPLGAYAPGRDPVKSMLMPYATVVDYFHYRLADTTANTSTGDLHQMPHIKSQVQRLHHMIQRFTVIKPLRLLT